MIMLTIGEVVLWRKAKAVWKWCFDGCCGKKGGRDVVVLIA